MKKIIYLFCTVIVIIYSIWYTSLGGFIGNVSALSKTGLVHPALFTIWGIATFTVLAYGTAIGFRATKYRFYIPLLTIAGIGMLLTLCFDFDYDKHTEYILHCAGSLTFSAIMGVLIFLLFLLTKDYVPAIISAVILFCDLVLLIIYKETAFIELAPIFAGYVMLYIHNTVRKRELINA